MANDNRLIPKPVSSIGKRINETDADKWVESYKKKNPLGPWGTLFGRELLEEMLHDEQTEGLWFFNGLTETGDFKMVIYQADKEGKIIKESPIRSVGANGLGHKPGDDGSNCPPTCP